MTTELKDQDKKNGCQFCGGVATHCLTEKRITGAEVLHMVCMEHIHHEFHLASNKGHYCILHHLKNYENKWDYLI